MDYTDSNHRKGPSFVVSHLRIGNEFGFPVKRTMMSAQKLEEAGCPIFFRLSVIPKMLFGKHDKLIKHIEQRLETDKRRELELEGEGDARGLRLTFVIRVNDDVHPTMIGPHSVTFGNCSWLTISKKRLRNKRLRNKRLPNVFQQASMSPPGDNLSQYRILSLLGEWRYGPGLSRP